MNSKETEVMNILQEECAEVIQAVSKCARFGIDNYKPQARVTNREHLEEEGGDLLCMLQLMMEMGVLNEKKVYDAALQKRAKLHKWSNIFTHDVTTE